MENQEKIIDTMADIMYKNARFTGRKFGKIDTNLSLITLALFVLGFDFLNMTKAMKEDINKLNTRVKKLEETPFENGF